MAPGSSAPVLSRRVLNRTLLHRQRLLERGPWEVAETIDHLVGMQSQVPKAPFVGLWTRIEGFEAAELDQLMLERRYVRGSLMRTTLHLVSADDAVALRPLFAPVLERSFIAQRAFRDGVSGLDAAELREVGRDILEAEPIGTGELGRRLVERYPGRDPSALAHAIRFWLPLVQVTPRGTWASKAAPRFATYRAWLGRSPAERGDAAALLRRYLAAFGPASVADMRVWSWLTGLRAIVDAMADELRTFRDESGRVLYDLPDAPILSGEEQAPIRFLPEYDNVLLSHEDRTRVVDRWLIDPVFTRGSVLVDGFVGAAWSVRSSRHSVRLVVETFRTLPPAERVPLETEADGLLRFLSPGAERREVEITAAE